MLKSFWVGFVKILKQLFTTPERTALEQELARQVDYLQTELSRAREREHEFYLRLSGNDARPEPISVGPNSVSNPLVGAATRIHELESLSRQRKAERDRILAANLADMERKAKADEEAIKRQEAEQKSRESLHASE